MALTKVTQGLYEAPTGAYSFRNLIINGDMRIAQRGTTHSGTNDYGSVDRFRCFASTGGVTFAQANTSPPEGFSHYLTTTGTPSGEFIIEQGIELPGAGMPGMFSVGQTVTVSYYAKSTVAGDPLHNALVFRNASGTSTNQVNANDDAYTRPNTLTTSWQRYVKTYNILYAPNASNIALGLLIRSSSTPQGNISITGIQVELGSAVTPFERRPYQTELQLCQRYYQLIAVGCYHSATATNQSISINATLQTAMRYAPTASEKTAIQSSNVSGTYPVSDVILRADGCLLRAIASASGIVDYRAVWQFSAEY